MGCVGGATATTNEREATLEPVYSGRVYCCGDAAEKDKQERTAANAHAEGEFVALDVLRAVDGKPPLPAYVCPPRLCAISLGKFDGIVVLGQWVALRGLLAAIAKALIQIYFVNFLPLPYWLMRRLPGRQPRRYGGSGGTAVTEQLARSGGRGLNRKTDTFGNAQELAEVMSSVGSASAAAVRPVPNSSIRPVDAEPASALVIALAAAIAGTAAAHRILRGGFLPV